MDIKDRLRTLIDLLGLNLKDFSKKTGMAYPTLLHYLDGARRPTTSNLQKIAIHTDCDLNWLLTGEGEPFVKPPEGIKSEDFVFVPVVSGKISAGKGLVPDTTIELKLAFRHDWIKRHGDPRKMSLIRVSGDSMEPTLYSGDIVLVDHNRNYIDPQGSIYAITVDDVIMIKRLQSVYPSRKIRIISDNPRYEAFELNPDQVIINGKIKWFAREIEH